MEAFARRAYGKALCNTCEMKAGLVELRRALAQFEVMEKRLEAEATQKLLNMYH